MNSRSSSLLSIDCEGVGVRRRKAGEWKTHTGSFPSYLPLLSAFSHGLEYQNMPTSLSWLEGRGRYWCRIHRHGTDAGHALSCSYLRLWRSSGCGGRRTVLRRWYYGSKVSLASVLFAQPSRPVSFLAFSVSTLLQRNRTARGDEQVNPQTSVLSAFLY